MSTGINMDSSGVATISADVLATPPSISGGIQPSLERYRAQLFCATWSSYAGFYLTRKVFGIVKAPMKAALGVDDLALSWIWTAYLVAYMAGMFATAAFGRRLGNRRLLLLGMGVSIGANLLIGTLLGGGTAAYWYVLGIMIIHGLAQATGWPSNVALMANWTRRSERGTVMGIWGTCYQLGAVAAKSAAAFLFGYAGLAWSYWGTALMLGAVWLLFYAWARESPEASGLPPMSDSDTDAMQSNKQMTAAASEAPLRSVLRTAVAMGLIYFTFKFLRYALDSWSALLIAETFHWSTTDSGYLSTLFDWVGFAGVVLGGMASDRLFGGRRTPVIVLMTVGMFLALLFLWRFGTLSPWLFGLGLGLVGFMLMGPDALVSGTAAMEVGSRRQALTVVAIVNGMGSAGPIVQEPLIGWLKTTHGGGGIMPVLAAVAAVAVLGVGAFGRRQAQTTAV